MVLLSSFFNSLDRCSDSRAMTFWSSLPETEVVILLNKDMMACHSFSFC